MAKKLALNDSVNGKLQDQKIINMNSKKKLNESPEIEKSFSSKTEEFFKTIKLAEKQKVLVIIKGYPDPDSIASSLAFQYISSHFNIECVILYFDEISHLENKALVKKLGIDMIRYDESFDFSPYRYMIFSDTQTTDLPINIPEHLKPLILVDHHKNLGMKDANFIDIRENAGSTSSIYTEYLIQGPIELEPSDPEAIRLATALMYGIRSDTDNFLLATDIDFIASAYLSQLSDRDLLSIISHQSLSAKTMDITQTALQNKDIKGTYLFSGVGFVREDDRDSIGQAADYLLRREGIETVIVYGIVGDKYIDGSLRTTSHTLDPDKWIKDLFGFNNDGKPFGGGRRDKGGFQLPLGVFSKCNDKELLWQVSKHTIEDIFYKKIGTTRENKPDKDK